jgi:mRNA interferase RelE/StbE
MHRVAAGRRAANRRIYRRQVDLLKYSYYVARMQFEILLAPEAVRDLKRLRADVRSNVRAALHLHLRHEPRKVSRSRIKRLSGLQQPQFRLRVDNVRVFYDVVGESVHILAIVRKMEADSWLAQFGKPE